MFYVGIDLIDVFCYAVVPFLLAINHSGKFPEHSITRDPARAELYRIKDLLVVGQQKRQRKHGADPPIGSARGQ